MNFAPSQYQQAIFNWVQNGDGHALIEAVAGSGKTTTLIKASQLIPQKKILFCAFNKHIKQEISQKILHQNSDIKTVHSIGFGCIGRYLRGKIQPVEQYKYSALVKRDFYYAIEGDLQAYLDQFSKNEQNIRKNKMFMELEEFIKYIRMTLTNPDDLQEIQDLIEHFSLETEYLDIFLPYVREIIDRGEEIARIERVIDYTDMVWLPYYWDLKPKQYEWIFVDEAQDLNKASLDLILKSCSKNGRIIFVGDEKQAIYGFSGADSQSIKNIQKVTGAQRFPLSICYRCPKSHIKLAKDIVPHIEAAPDAIYGFVKKIDEDEMLSKIKINDLILCRLNYPLIRTALDLISRKIPASITGQNVADAMMEILSEIEVINGFSYSNMQDFIGLYLKKKIEQIKKISNSESQIEKIKDYCRGINLCHEGFQNAKSVEELRENILRLFKQNRGEVKLSTIHRAKGIENNRVFLLLSDKMPFSWEHIRDWEKEQELNLKYVALTRAKKVLFLVNTPKSLLESLY